ncbi:Lysophospholipase L1 [Marisediminitalea aggregata]|uniref:Lysophospholipase L1 n=1 Tax=Marisediminitalea aggregata TaxID=634436 RepID=A0A1M5SQZ5_9ALTE|nr:SGNH/GDSL hydrolase family protein [Marisediminitalea aggregata]SHH40393.1 Lysophospholipase L1 [Marisediminitalea aggregata]
MTISTASTLLSTADTQAALAAGKALSDSLSPEQIGPASSAALITSRQVARTNKITVQGDSLADDAFDVVSANQSGWNDWSYLTWFRRYINVSYSISASNLRALASQGTVHLVNTQLPQAIASDCGVAVTMIGTNDLGLGVDVIGNLTTFYDALRDNGIKAVALPVLPHDAADPLTAAEMADACTINRWLFERARVDPNMTYLTGLDVFTDYATGHAVTGYLRDGIHTTKIGAEVLGRALAEQFNAVFAGPSDAAYAVGTNAYDATTNPNGNALPNPFANGTGGSLANGATGTVADSFLVYRSSGSATFGCAASKEVIGTVPHQVVTLSGTGDGYIAIIEQSVALPAGWGEGDTLRGSVNILLDAVGIDYFAVGVWAAPSVGYDGGRTAANGDFPGQVSGRWSADVVVPAGATTIKLSVYAQVKSGVELSGTIKASKFFIEKVN